MAVDLAPPFRDLEFMTPLSGSHVDRLVKFAATDRVVVDVGCGWAELLLRVVAAEPRGCGLGIDLDEVAIGHGRDLARERGLVGRVELRIGDAREAFPDEIGSIICVGASQIWGSQVQEGHPLDYRAALRALRKPLAVGGR
ncbi:cyclopropane-fatty-acyl-phospholipid synthase family protein [Humibacillus sp. DSM 29435]|uniref:SAM-dependent methyltransferase n=1 Tax=Humibacillus sp. DSM 29435 TaxID=1869167 RepID=UPI0009F2F70A|nr:class I SAM-dependent methyltransferase [Humibacillus sp. DSM 29435]